MNDTLDYKAAYLRQKAARERVEDLLEARSRELYDANAVLQQQAALLLSENQQNKKLIERLSRVASQTSNGVVITGVDGRIEWSNDGFATLTGRDYQTLQGQSLAAILLDAEPEFRIRGSVETALETLAAFAAEVMLERAASGPCWVRVSGNPMHDDDGTVQGFMAILVDITQIKQAEKLKHEFTATVSHELRTPLTSVAGAIDLVNSGVLGEFPPEAAALLSVASRNCKRLRELIDDLLDMEKLLAGKLGFRFETLSALPLLQESIAATKPYFEGFGCSVDLQAESRALQLHVDPRRFHQIMANLLSNAAKFSPANSEVLVKLRQVAGKVRIEVTDHGPGIAPAFRHRVFEKFAQADGSGARSKGGTGLGLAITRELVHHMGGEIGFDSLTGTGTTFWLEWPAPTVASPLPDHQWIPV